MIHDYIKQPHIIPIPNNAFVTISIVAMHWILFSGTMLLILLTNDLSILIFINMFLYMVLTVNIIFGDCPISLMEDIYLGNSIFDKIGQFVPFNTSIGTRGNNSLQWIFMTIMVTTTKIILLLLKYCFHEFLSE